MKKIFTILTLIIVSSGISAQCGGTFYDGFESGTFLPHWTIGGGHTQSVNTTAPAVGSYSLDHTGGSSTHLQGSYATFTSGQPNYVSYRVKTNTTSNASGYVVIGDATVTANNCVFFGYATGGNYRFYNGTTSHTVPIVANQWYHVELLNINYTARTLDIHFNGSVIVTGFSFRSTTMNSVDRIHLYNFQPATAGYDEIIVGTVPPPSITCPSNITANSDSSSCGAVVNYTTPVDSCSTVSQIAGLASGSIFPIGVTTNTFIATNSTGVDTCSFTVTVVDSIVPTLSCPSNVVTCNSMVNNIAPTFSDNCNVNVTYTLSGATTGSGNNDVSGTTFNVGITTVQYMVADSSGNMDSCSFTVTYNTVDTSVSRNLSTFTSNETGATYQWLNCDSNFMAISGATNQSYTATTNGSYAVVVSKNGCTDTSACQMINNVGIQTIDFGNISIYPNPTTGMFTIDMGDYDETINYTLTSIDGRIVAKNSNITDNKIMIDLSNESKGVYLLKLYNTKSSSVFRITRL